jgi:hypothetical protein
MVGAVTVYGVRSGERESPSAMGYSLETRKRVI